MTVKEDIAESPKARILAGFDTYRSNSGQVDENKQQKRPGISSKALFNQGKDADAEKKKTGKKINGIMEVHRLGRLIHKEFERRPQKNEIDHNVNSDGYKHKIKNNFRIEIGHDLAWIG